MGRHKNGFRRVAVQGVVETYVIRRARREDGPEFLRLVQELALFEKLRPPGPAARRRLLADAFGRSPRFELFVAGARGRPGLVAYAIALRTYSSFLAKPSFYLEDLYISPGHRGTGLGLRLVVHLAGLVRRRGWGRLEGIVLAWNRGARRFYAKTGARELRGWIFFRYDEAALGRLARAR